MPPSYSMMLPGRMSTPLIFMSSLGESVGKEPRHRAACRPGELSGSLARRLFSGKHGVWVDRRSLPPALPRPHLVDREMQVRTGRACIARVADAGDHLAA